MSDEKSKATLLKEEIMMKGSKGAATLNAEEIKKADDFCVGYKKFLDHSPVEREAVSYTLELAKKAGFTEYDENASYNAGDKVYYVNRDKAIALAVIGKNGVKNGARLASKHDSRITPVGRVLRNLHLDELPQLFNVFMGDMSLVGPRPERQTLVREYCKEIPEFYYRLKVKAGLTGYAQVYGKYNTTPYDKLKLDLFYIENYSFILDLKLLMMTVKIFFQKEVSEGVNDNQTNALKDSVDPVKELSEKEPVDPEEKE